MIYTGAKGGPEKWIVEELKQTELCFKCPGDCKTPITKSALYQCCILICMRFEEDKNRLKEGETAVKEESFYQWLWS